MKQETALLCFVFVTSGIFFGQNVSQKCAGGSINRAVSALKPTESDEKSAPNDHNSVRDLLLGPGDLLEIKVYGAPDLSNTVRVSGSGEITMPLIGALKLSGMSVEVAQKALEQRFLSGGFVRDPRVNILVKEFATQGISVLGEVSHPGIYPMLGSRRLFDAIAAAGGTTNRAGKIVMVTHRDQNEAPSTLNLTENSSEIANENPELLPGDTIIVSKAGIIYVSGDVKMPGGYLMDSNESLSVLQAIALAQGLNPTASARNVRIIRKSDGKLQQIPVELKQIMAAKAPDVALQNEDVLLIPNSTSKTAARKSLESIVQVATGMAIYRR